VSEPPESDVRCAAASLLRDEPVTGTASTVRAFLLLEHPGPWGIDALRDARLPEGLGARLRARAAESGVRVLLVRRPGARAGGDGPARVFAAYAHPDRPRLEAGRVGDLADVLDLDLEGLRAGSGSGLAAPTDPAGPDGFGSPDGPLFCVCTHGRHDACCAERGRPVAAALAQAHPDETWEVSHIGGDRFAANLLVLPSGLYYGRLDAVSALSVAGSHLAGQLDLDHLRGRSGWAMPVQAAEISLRRDLGETRGDAVRLVRRSVAGGVTEAVFDVAGARYAVRVRSAPGAQQHRLTCRASRTNPALEHTLLDVTRVP
jgi:hypothetical protein